MAASTALEINASPAEELASAALDRGGLSGDAELILFGITTAVRHGTGMDVSGPARDLVRLDPLYHEQLAVLGLEDPGVRALIGIASGNHEMFLSSGFSGELDRRWNRWNAAWTFGSGKAGPVPSIGSWKSATPRAGLPGPQGKGCPGG
jgi:hypothetical protein